MDSLSICSTWLITTAAAALGPLIALLIGIAGTDRLLSGAARRDTRPRLAEERRR